MLAWLEDYPRNYGYIDAAQGNNDFFTTMEKLDVRLPAPDSLVVVAEPLLQQLTINLVPIEPQDGGFSYFLGTQTAVGMVPSLTWLSMTRARERKGNHAYKAWISAQDDPQEAGALNVALARLGGAFEEFGFTVDTGRRLPRDMTDAGLAVVTAHGGLMAEGRYIHSIRDEGTLVEAPSALATALAGIEVVILFVCSGGRIDKHPWDNRTVGLPKQLLEKGARAVIASPWPLDVKVTYRWLGPFLRNWETGSTILQATKKANEAVAQALGDGPQYSLAMTVYGDVLLTK
ncbi:CHAT domain-containing protein [Variovorax sp. OV700]|uniref:CHAT domain-containing protein n=1 Tax=Variovorax sp. OV700 TaxID=1882826 RepID=UPI001C319DF4|nr:CHAT domain-containing protein [Variovorax sp. OV700]